MAVVNGLEVNDMMKMLENVKQNPASAKATMYATTNWKGGFHNEAEISNYTMGGAKLKHARTFKIEGDQPENFLGTDKGPASVEILLAALGHCISNNWAMFGASMGVSIESLRLEVEGDLDVQGRMGLPEPGKVRPGYQTIRITHYVKSKAPKEVLEQIKQMAEDRSPTKDSLRAVSFSSQLVIE
jgi:uncharacterized OsmC-like protein